MKWEDYDAALFDLDGVITPTAELHMRAWSDMFNAYLAGLDDQPPYTDADYFTHVDGKPRFAGVSDFLISRGIDLAPGSPDDAAERDTVWGLGNRKNDAFNAVLERDGITAYPGSVALLDHLEAIGLPVAVVSSSANAPTVLETAGLLERFSVIVDGRVAAARSLPGKPAPDTFIAAATDLGVAWERSVVIEDAVSGVRAGSKGFALVVGVDRGAGAAALTEAGADLVVRDLAELVPGDGADR